MSASTSELEKDIEASRARLDRTIDAIQDRLSPGSLVEEMLGSARRTPLNSLYDDALRAVRRNPLPVLLIAAGVGMLMRRMPGEARRSSAAPPPLPPALGDRRGDADSPHGDPVPGGSAGTHAKP